MSENQGKLEKDEELDELLDSALSDFDKKVEKVEPTDENKLGDSPVDLWNSEFLAQPQDDNFEDMIKKNLDTFFSGLGQMDPDAGKNFEEQFMKMADVARKVVTEPSGQNAQFDDVINQTLKDLTDEAENLKAQMGPDAIAAMLGGMGLEDLGSPGSPDDVMPMMQNLMQMFLSKDVFYPPMKEITEKYPNWLEENKDKCPEKDLNNFKKQFELMTTVCGLFEEEKSNDSDEIKKTRFSKIISLMEEMQKLGQPPKDLTGDTPFENNGQLKDIPGFDQSQCSLM